MEKEIADLLRDKSFHELNADERSQLTDLCESEEEFEQMRNLFIGIEAIKTEEFKPRKETKASLDAIFATQSKQRSVIWYNSLLVMLYPQDKPIQRRPIIQIAAAVVLVLLMVPFLTNDKIVQQSNQVAKVEKKQESQNDLKSAVDNNDLTVSNESLKVEDSDIFAAGKIVETSVADEIVNTEDVIFSSEVSLAEAELKDDEVAVAAPSAKAEASTTAIAFDHPDGIFTGTVISYSKTVKQQPAVLDLLTAAF